MAAPGAAAAAIRLMLRHRQKPKLVDGFAAASRPWGFADRPSASPWGPLRRSLNWSPARRLFSPSRLLCLCITINNEQAARSWFALRPYVDAIGQHKYPSSPLRRRWGETCAVIATSLNKPTVPCIWASIYAQAYTSTRAHRSILHCYAVGSCPLGVAMRGFGLPKASPATAARPTRHRCWWRCAARPPAAAQHCTF